MELGVRARKYEVKFAVFVFVVGVEVHGADEALFFDFGVVDHVFYFFGDGWLFHQLNFDVIYDLDDLVKTFEAGFVCNLLSEIFD